MLADSLLQTQVVVCRLLHWLRHFIEVSPELNRGFSDLYRLLPLQ